MKFNTHIEKYSRANAGGVEKEQKRLYTCEKYRNEVNTELSHLNIYHGREYRWRDLYRPLVKEHEQTAGRRIRSNAVVALSLVQTVPKSWPRQVVIDYFEKYNQWLRAFLESNGIDSKKTYLSDSIHFDETEPHQTYVFMPFKEGKFNAKKIMDKLFLSQIQEQGYHFYCEWSHSHPGLEILEPYKKGSKKKHLSEQEFKLKKDADNLKKFKAGYSTLEKIVQREMERDSNWWSELCNDPIIDELSDDELDVLNDIADQQFNSIEQMLDDMELTL